MYKAVTTGIPYQLSAFYYVANLRHNTLFKNHAIPTSRLPESTKNNDMKQ